MKILVLNQGSSSLKCAIYAFSQKPLHTTAPIWQQKIIWDEHQSKEAQLHEVILPCLTDHKLDCVGHRVVQGANKYHKSIAIDRVVKQDILRFAELAPLHNKEDLEGIETFEKLLPNTPQIAVFDSSFHHTMPLSTSLYPGPYAWKEHGIQKFGFHGISYQYCTRKAKEMSSRDIENMVICHLGAGASLCAVKRDKSIDTTMGMTPLDGLMMGTRSGSIDPGILLYLLHKKGKTASELSHELYTQSGLLGISGIASDMQTILNSAKQGNTRAQLALEMYIHRLSGQIGLMIGSLGGLDTLVFTGGIGENSEIIRQKACLPWQFLGIRLSSQQTENDAVISSSDSKIQVLKIHTQEEFEIARECWHVLTRSS